LGYPPSSITQSFPPPPPKTGSLFMLTASGMIWFWFFITVNLFMRMILNKDFNNVHLVIAGLVLSVIMTLPVVIIMDFGTTGAWCFISGSNWQLLYLDYYAVMGVCSIVGAFLWSAIMYKIYQSGKQLSQFVSPRKTAEDVHIQNSVNEKTQLFFRQLAFVTVFEVMFVIFFATRISSTISQQEGFLSWVFHTIMMSTMGLYTFLIFGLKRQNFELWGAFLRGAKVSAEYERIR